MAKCPNCGAGMSCGCQRRTASNGATACSSCVNKLEAKLTAEKQTAQSNIALQKEGKDRYNK